MDLVWVGNNKRERHRTGFPALDRVDRVTAEKDSRASISPELSPYINRTLPVCRSRGGIGGLPGGFMVVPSSRFAVLAWLQGRLSLTLTTPHRTTQAGPEG